ncbi:MULTISPECIES: OmpA family protein [unclassified Janthinobacterium]|uniref:OmpA family protein n=1 Tax=unclassified Janthinobacterium TaxID=2610881 RepID=UPI0008F478B2|nr:MULTISPECIES: OmpA family protein [unclassified Janthinobacterium]APA69079.1 membrane protein [Janthinobacterium sp. 1_2014MBL_MicDiv]MDN2712194.1 OmpA family protein [Janthinobacterium sp. SUN118]
MQCIYKQLRLGLLAPFLLMLGLLTACQSAPEKKPLFNAEQVAVLKEQGFNQTDEGWELSFTDKLLFEFDAAKLTPPSRSAIQKISAALLKVGITHMRVEGHTDNEGTEAYNNKLSLARANVVADAMSATGVPRDNITVKGLGMSKPVASNASKTGKAENRRVTIIVSAP